MTPKIEASNAINKVYPRPFEIYGIHLNTASKLNIDIPKDLSIVGFGDKLTSMLSLPQLTIINQHAVQIGKKSVRMLINRINSKSTENTFVTEIIPTTTQGGSSK